MADIFISYSSKDRAQAELLIELLGSAGLSVWIDKSGIDVATTWSGEIVDAIEGCKAFVVLLSPHSIESVNVLKEVSLAAELKKKIVPLDLEPVELSRDLRYHLAGIQRSPMTNIDAIIRVFGKLGLDATQAPSIKLVKESDERKSIMILPFEDLSPTGDNGWFADGIVSEMISALSNVKALRVTDAATTKDFKRYQGTLPKYAHEMGIRYFVQGDVRKFGDNIKITSRLLDIETGDHLWQDSMKGTMDDIFDIQEKVAERVVEGLKVHLAADEKSRLARAIADTQGTANAEAYELSLRATANFARQTKEGFQVAIQLLTEAIKLDPGFASAYPAKANSLAALYRGYSRDPALLKEGFELVEEALRMKPDLVVAYNALTNILMLQGKHEEAEKTAIEYVRRAPKDSSSHFALGFFYGQTRQHSKAIAPLEQSLKLKPDNLVALFHLVHRYSAAHDTPNRVRWAETALPMYARQLKLFPEDEMHRVNHAIMLHWAERDEEARKAARTLETLRDGVALYNAACLQCELREYADGIHTMRKAMAAGYRNMPLLRTFLHEADSGIGKLEGTPEWQGVREMVESVERSLAADLEAKANG